MVGHLQLFVRLRMEGCARPHQHEHLLDVVGEGVMVTHNQARDAMEPHDVVEEGTGHGAGK